MLIKCEVCEKEFYKRPSHYKRVKHHFCSVICRGISHLGIGNPAWKDNYKECLFCGVKFKPEHKETKFCSQKCMGKSYENKIKRKCLTCEKEFEAIPARTANLYCSFECSSIAHSKRMTMEGNSNWKGGKSFESYPVDWTETLRRSIRERDRYTCQLCSKQQGDETFAVHHIDYDKQNCNPNNLISLCSSCHGKTNFNREKWKKELSKKLQQ